MVLEAGSGGPGSWAGQSLSDLGLGPTKRTGGNQSTAGCVVNPGGWGGEVLLQGSVLLRKS